MSGQSRQGRKGRSTCCEWILSCFSCCKRQRNDHKKQQEQKGWAYGRLQASQGLEEDGYAVIRYESFHQLIKTDAKDSKSTKHGWKFHLSIDDSVDDDGTTQSNLARGWDIIAKILIERGVTHFKVISPGLQMHTPDKPQPHEKGKQVTIYAHDQHPPKTPDQWEEILQEITTALVKAQIRPSHHPPRSSKLIPGSHYISYRNDCMPADKKGDEDRYLEPSAGTYKHRRITEDPYEGIRMAIPEGESELGFIPEKEDFTTMFRPPTPT